MTYQGEIEEEDTVAREPHTIYWQYPDFITPSKTEVIENELFYDDVLRKGFGRELITEGLYVWYAKFRTLSEKPILVRTDGSHVQMIFSLQSVTTYYPETSAKAFVRFKAQQHNLFLLPQRNMLVKWKEDEEVELFAINLSTEFFFNHLPVTHPLYDHFQKGIKQVMPAFMSWRNLPVTSRMIAALFEIINCNYTGYHKNLFIKAKVIELLALQFEQYEQLPVPNIAYAAKDLDIEKMHLARQIIADNLEKTWSLKDLAHQVGTNEFNLKKFFKEVFGKPVFTYLHDLRMETSMQMLQIQGSRVAEIAQKTGYKHSTHFTAAFKKYYGILPNKVRIGILNLLHISHHLVQLVTEMLEETATMEAL